MNEKIDHALEVLLDKIENSIASEEAMKYAQAALNLAHAKEVLTEDEYTRSRMKGAGA